jgi:hypothetical protein
MNVCKSSEFCEKENCPHKIPHDCIEEPENSCVARCDVSGGIVGSVCVAIHNKSLDEDAQKAGCPSA